MERLNMTAIFLSAGLTLAPCPAQKILQRHLVVEQFSLRTQTRFWSKDFLVVRLVTFQSEMPRLEASPLLCPVFKVETH